MGQVSDFIEPPYQGVSQAAPAIRLPEQAEILDDSWATIPDGWGKRPPFEYLFALDADVDWRADALFEPMTAVGSVYALLIQLEGSDRIPHVIDFDAGTEDVVNVTTDAQSYLNNGAPQPNNDLRALQVADTVFVANRNRPVENGSSTQAARPFEAIVWVRQASFGRTYSLTVTENAGTPRTGTYRTPDGSASTSNEFIDTDVIAAVLLDGAALDTSLSIPDAGEGTGDLQDDLEGDGFTVTRVGSVIYISNSVDFTITATDGQGGDAMIVVKGRAQSFAELPKKAVDGFTVRITNQSADDADDFFVKFTETAGSGTGVWDETIEPGTNLGVNSVTMPLTLTYSSGSGEWTIDTASWGARTVGNADLSPDPSFIGLGIEDLTFWKGRLGFVYDEYVSLSAADDPFVFYPRSLSLVSDADPIERESPFDQRSVFRYAVAFDERCVLFGDKVQCALTSDGVATPTTVDINVRTTYQFAEELRPGAVNDKIYFGSPAGTTASLIMEYTADAVTDRDTADNMNVATPRWLPAGVDRRAYCPVMFTAVYGKSGTRYLYPHLFRYSGDERVQNAWKRWRLPADWVLGGMFFEGTQLYVLAIEVVSGGNDRGHLLRLDITPGLLDEHANSRILTHLDCKLNEAVATPSYDSGLDRTTITIPYEGNANTRVVARAPGGTGGITWGGNPQDLPEGFPADVVSTTATTVVVEGDWSSVPYYVGDVYESKWRLSTLFVRGDNNSPRRDGRTEIGKIIFDLARTGYIRVEVTVGGRAARRYSYNGYRWDDPNSIYNVAPNANTPFRVPIRGENEYVVVDVINDSWFSSYVTGYEWLGEFNARAQKIG